MSLDFYTVFIMMSIVFVTVLIFNFIIYNSRKTFPGSFLWLASTTSFTIGIILIALRDKIPYFLSAPVGSTLVTLHPYLIAHSFWMFRRKERFPLWIYGLGLFFILFYLLFSYHPIRIRILIFTFGFFVGMMIATVILLWKIKPENRWSHLFLAFPLVVAGVGQLARFFSVLINPPASEHFMQQHGVATASFVLAALVTILFSYGYYLITFERVELELKEQDVKIKQQVADLQKLNDTKDKFFSIIAHDLKGPFSSAIRLLTSSNDPDKDDSYRNNPMLYQTLAKELEKVTLVLDNLLWWAQSQQFEIEVKKDHRNLHDMVSDVFELWNKSAEYKGIRLINEVPHQQNIFTDPNILSTILRNLISNSIKFNREGGFVRLWAAAQGQIIRLVLEDTGTGISPEVIEKMNCSQPQKSTLGTAGEAGSGIGLMLCRDFIELLGGTLQIQSQPAAGSVFIIQLPQN